MTARVIRESWDGGKISVDTRRIVTSEGGATRPQVVLDVTERGLGEVVIHLTPAETVELVVALNAKLVELAHPQDTRSSASPVVDDRGAGPSELDPAGPGSITQTAPDGAGAAPTGEEASSTPRVPFGGQNRTPATGLSNPVESGRPAFDECWPGCPTCQSLRRATAELLANSTPVGGDR